MYYSHLVWKLLGIDDPIVAEEVYLKYEFDLFCYNLHFYIILYEVLTTVKC